MSAKTQEASTMNQFDLEVKQPNKTKKVVLLNNEMLTNDNRINNDQLLRLSLHNFEMNSKPAMPKVESNLSYMYAMATNDGKASNFFSF